MATRNITLPLDEDLIRRIRRRDTDAAAKSDAQIIEDALVLYLADRALDEARAQGTLDPDEADRLAVDEVRVVRRARRSAA